MKLQTWNHTHWCSSLRTWTGQTKFWNQENKHYKNRWLTREVNTGAHTEDRVSWICHRFNPDVCLTEPEENTTDHSTLRGVCYTTSHDMLTACMCDQEDCFMFSGHAPQQGIPLTPRMSQNVVISQTHWLVSQERLSPKAGTSVFIDLSSDIWWCGSNIWG